MKRASLFAVVTVVYPMILVGVPARASSPIVREPLKSTELQLPAASLFDALTRLEDPGSPVKREPAGLLSHTIERSWSYFRPTRDLNGDGLDDVVKRLVAAASYDDGAADWYYHLELTAIRGTDGRQMWSKRFEIDDGWVVAVPARVGMSGGNGFLVYTYSDTTYAGYDIDITAISGLGRVIWRQTVPGMHPQRCSTAGTSRSPSISSPESRGVQTTFWSASSERAPRPHLER